MTKTAGRNKPPGLGEGKRDMRPSFYQLSRVSVNK